MELFILGKSNRCRNVKNQVFVHIDLTFDDDVINIVSLHHRLRIEIGHIRKCFEPPTPLIPVVPEAPCSMLQPPPPQTTNLNCILSNIPSHEMSFWMSDCFFCSRHFLLKNRQKNENELYLIRYLSLTHFFLFFSTVSFYSSFHSYFLPFSFYNLIFLSNFLSSSFHSLFLLSVYLLVLSFFPLFSLLLFLILSLSNS